MVEAGDCHLDSMGCQSTKPLEYPQYLTCAGIADIFYRDTVDLEVSTSSATFHVVSIIYLTTTLMRDNSHFLGHTTA
jgi:hypothetical protein